MTNNNNKSGGTCAVIYCRVSSTKQKTEGSGLESQEHRCRQYAEARGFEVEAVFPDDASGGGDFMKRPGMVNLLRYIDAQPDKNYVVIFDDLKRFARDTEFHIKLRREFQQRDARIECLNFKLDDTPEGKFVETIFAAQGELEREQNRRQVIQKMKARVEKGYYVFHPPIGYRYEKDRTHGKLLGPQRTCCVHRRRGAGGLCEWSVPFTGRSKALPRSQAGFSEERPERLCPSKQGQRFAPAGGLCGLRRSA